MASGSDAGKGDGGAGGTRADRRIRARFAGDEGGATAVEYTLLVGLIGLALVGAMRTYTDKMVLVYQALATAMTTP